MNRKLNMWLSEGLILLYCLPIENQIFASISTIMRYGQYLGLIWSVLIFFKLKIYTEKTVWPIWLFILIMLFSTLINGTDVGLCIKMVFPIFASCVITIHIIKVKDFQGLEVIATIFSVLVILQAISAMLGGIGSYIDGNMITQTNYFFGDRVSFNRVFIYAIALFSTMLIHANRRKLLYGIGILSGVYFVFYEKVSTAVVTFAVYIFIIIVAKVIKSENVWRNMMIFLFFIAAFFVIVGMSPNGFKWILVDILGEDMTLDGRTLLWAQAIKNMHGWHWILGNGYGHSYMFWLGTWGVNTAHSQYMNILFCFGFVGICLYFLVIYQFLNGLKTENNENYKHLIVATVAAIIICGIPTTTYTSVYLYILYIVFAFPKIRLYSNLPDVGRKELS